MEYKGKHLTGYVPDYVVFDLETTGLSPWSDRIIEISAVKVKSGSVVDTYSTLVNPNCSIPAQASAVNGITNSMVRNAPCLMEAMERFLEFVGDHVLVGHNIHAFDLKFLERALEELYCRELDNASIDTLTMARNCLPQLPRHRLVDLAAYFHISTEGAHRALNDCMMNQKCFEEMGALLKKQAADHGKAGDPKLCCPRCGGALTLRNGRFGQFYGCKNFPSCRYTRNP